MRKRTSPLSAAHFSFTVSRLEQSRAFYRDVLGLEQIYDIEHNHPYTSTQVGFPGARLLAAGFKLRAGDGGTPFPTLELIEYQHPRGAGVDLSTNNPGVAHLAFHVDDIFAEYERLVAAGVTFRSEPVLIEEGRNKGGYTAYFLDPDGITLELGQPPASPRSAVTGRRSFEAEGPWAGAWGYARAVRVGDRIEVSGTTAIDADGGVVAPDDAYAQSRYVLGVIERALNALGAGLEDVVRTRAFLRSIDDWRDVGRAHLEAFGSVMPASSCIGGARLLKPDLCVELEAVAVVTADAEPATAPEDTRRDGQLIG